MGFVSRTLAAALAVTATAAAANAAAAQPAPARGAALFKACQACHTIDRDGEATAGPNLWGVYGKKAGAKEDFPYSRALTSSGLVWNDANLDKWLTAPTKFVPGSVMAYPGMKDPADRQAVIAFLKTKK